MVYRVVGTSPYRPSRPEKKTENYIKLLVNSERRTCHIRIGGRTPNPEGRQVENRTSLRTGFKCKVVSAKGRYTAEVCRYGTENCTMDVSDGRFSRDGLSK